MLSRSIRHITLSPWHRPLIWLGPNPLQSRLGADLRRRLASTIQDGVAPAATSTARPLHIERELPEIKTNNKLRYFGTAVGLAIWVGGMAWAFNYQRLCSAAVTSTLFVTRHHPVAIEALGEPIAFESGWPWISGTINQLKGIVEISMRIRGTKAAGVLSVKTYRSNNEWSDREFQLRLDNGRIINLLDASSSLGAQLE